MNTTSQFQNQPTSILQKVANSLSDPDSALALSLAAALPLLRRGGKFASRHPVVALGIAGVLVAGYFLNSKNLQKDDPSFH